MKHHVTSWNKRILAWVLSLAMVTGLLTTYIQTVAQNASQTEYVTGEPAMNAMKVIYEEDFGAYEDAALTEGDNEKYNLYIPSGVTASVAGKKLSVEATADSAPVYILGGEMWGYYTLEADITYASATKGAEVCFYVQNADKYVVATLPAGQKGDAYHVQLIANAVKASISYGAYNVLGIIGDMSEPMDIDVAVSEQSGSVGFDITPIEGVDVAAMSIDNIEVTRNVDQEEAKHTLFNVSFDEYTSSKTMAATNTYDDYYIKRSATGISVVANNQKLYLTSDNSGYGVMYFDVADAVHWDNYVVEADVCQTNTEGWGSLLYRVQGLDSFQSGGLQANGTASLKGYWHDWVNNGEDNGIYHSRATGAEVAPNTVRRLKIVVQGNTADLYAASYTDDDNTKSLGDWQYLLSINDVADHHATGSVGFLVAEGAEYWIDNLDVYEYTTTYFEDFDYADTIIYDGSNYEVSNDTLPEDATADERKWNSTLIEENATTGITTQLYKADSANSKIEIASGALKIQRLNDSQDNIKSTLAWLEAGESWTNYTYEADIHSRYVSSAYFHGMAYRVGDRSMWQRAGLAYAGGNVLSRVGSGTLNEVEINGVKTYLDQFTCYYDYNESTNTNIGFKDDAKLRMKVVVKNNRTWIYTARYQNEILEPYNLHMVLDSCESFVGAAGMVVSHKYTVTYDNLVVAATSQEAGTTTLADIVEPNTGIVNPPTVVTKVDETNYKSLEGTAVAILDINSNLDILGKDGNAIGSVPQFMHKYGDTVIPAFYLDSSTDVTVICNYLEKHVITDALYVTNDAALLLSARQKWGFVRGVLEYDEMPTDHAATRRELSANLAMVAILPNEELTQELVAEYNVRGVSIWSHVKDAADIYKGIANGYNGLIASNPETILDIYESITVPTLSGKPIVIGHQGMFVQGEYYGNNIQSYTTAINTYGAMGVEIDAKITRDGKFVMMHDTTLDRTTTGKGIISQMDLSEIQQYKTKCGQEIPTLEKAMEELSKTDAVVYIDHATADPLYMAEYKRLIEQYEMHDQVVVLCGRTHVTDAASTYVWKNSDWGENLPVISGSLWLERDYDVANVTVEDIISNSIHRLSRYNHQQIPFENPVLGQGDETAYNVSARGFLYLQCTTPATTVSRDEAEEKQNAAKQTIDEAYISEKGVVAAIIDDPERTQNYAHEIQVKDEVVKIGETLNLDKTIQKVVGTETATCDVICLEGNVINKNGNFTMVQPGDATVVYYKDISLERGYNTLTYRIYSEPVTITWNETGFVCDHEWSTKYSYTDDNHYQVCTKDGCGATGNIAFHTEAATLVGQRDATAEVAGYTGDVVCATCGYIMDKGEEIPADPFAGYTTITPADFGIADDTYTTAKSCTKTPLSSFDKVNFAIEFSGQLKNWTGIVYGKANNNKNEGITLAYHGSYPGRLMIVNNASSRFSMYTEDGTLSNHLYIKPEEVFLKGEYTTFVGANVRLNITTDLWDFNDDGQKNDLRVGFWFDGNLYKGQYYYLANVTGGTYVLNHDMQIGAVGDPGVTIKSPLTFISETSPLDGYEILTPSTFDIADQENTEGVTTQTSVCEHVKPSDYAGTAFAANIKYTTNWSNMSFLQHNVIGAGIQVVFSSTGELNVYNRLNNRTNERGYMYAGGYFTEDTKEYIPDGYDVIKANTFFAIKPSKTNVEGGKFKDTMFTLWLTMDVVDFDHDTYADDMKLGVWINGQLYEGRYLYITNCDAQADADGFWINERVIVTNVTHISSPFMELEEVGITAGEYMSSEGEFYPTEVTNSPLMNGKTFKTPIRFEGEGATFYYGSADDAVKFTSTADGIKVTHTYGSGETNLVTLKKDNVGIDVTKRSFDLKLTTTKVNSDSDSAVDDVKLDISVNGKVRSFYITDAADLLTAQAGVQCEDGAAVIVGTMAQLQPVKVYHCLDAESYVQAYDASTMNRLSLNGLAKAESFSLTKSGTYRIASTTDGIVNRSEVTTYRTNDVTGDDAVNIKDLVRMLKIADANYADETVETQTLPGRLAIGCLDVAIWKSGNNWTVLNSIRKGLLNQIKTNVDQTVLPEQSIQ